MHITRIAIHRPVTTTMATLALVFLGIVSLSELLVQQLPDVEFPGMSYQVYFRNQQATPEETNEQLTRPFERLVASLPGLKKTLSHTWDGGFWGYAEFAMGTDMRYRAIEIQDRANAWLARNPALDVQMRITPHSTDEWSDRLMLLLLSTPVGRDAEVAVCADKVRRRLRAIDGVADVQVYGDRSPRVVLEAERDRLAAQGLNVGMLRMAIENRARDRTWLGPLESRAAASQVYLDSKVETLRDLMGIRVDSGGIYHLGDVATPRRRVERSDWVYRHNGREAVRVGVSRERDRNIIRLAKRVRGEVDALNADLPAGFELSIQHDEAEPLEKLIGSLLKLAGVGATLAVIVLLVFLRSWRIASIVAVAIPTSVVATFNAMYAAGLTINLLSLLGLAVGIGMLLDNAIVVVENVFRHSQRIADHREAAWLGSREVARAIVIATVTNLIVFVPLLFVDDMIVIIMREMALCVVFPMTVSLITAMTLVPMLTSRVIAWRRRETAGGRSPGEQGRIRRIAERFVPRLALRRRRSRPRNLLREIFFLMTKASLRHPVRLLVALAVALLLTIVGASARIAVQKMEPQRKTYRVTLYGRPPVGVDLDTTDAFFQEKEKQIRDLLEESDVFESFGTRFSKEGGQIELAVAPKYQWVEEWEFETAFRHLESGDDRTGFRFRPFATAGLADAEAASPDERSGSEAVLITGDNVMAMVETAVLVRRLMEADGEVGEVFLETPLGDPEVQFHPDMPAIQTTGANLQDLQDVFRSQAGEGIVTSLVLEEKDVRREVTLRVSPGDRRELDEGKEDRTPLREVREAEISTRGGGSLALENLGKFAVTHGSPGIRKENRRRTLRLSFNLLPRVLKAGEKERQRALTGIAERLGDMPVPSGVNVELAGSLGEAAESGRVFRRLLWLGILAVYVVMAFFFESLIWPLVVMLSLPLASIGVVWAIILMGARFDEVAMFGAIITVGLVVNPPILLVEYARRAEKERGFSRHRALMAAVAFRFRPILMTTSTTVLGVMPVLLSREAGMEARSLVAPLLGGLIAGSLLTLVVIPASYHALAAAADAAGRRRRRFLQSLKDRFRAVRGRQAAAPEPAPAFASFAPAVPRLSEAPFVPWFRSVPGSVGAPTRVAAPSGPERLPRLSIENVSRYYSEHPVREAAHRFVPSRRFLWGRRPAAGHAALRRVTLEAGPGMVGLLGPNGAGKTTLLRIAAGLLAPTYGTVRVTSGGHTVDTLHHPAQVRRLVSYVPQELGVYANLTIEQYLAFFATWSSIEDPAARRRRIDEVVEIVGLTGARGKLMKRFSGGMRQRAGLAQMLLDPGPFVIVDEPTAGLDPLERVRLRLELSRLARDRVVLLSTHIVDDITSSCRRVAVLSAGRLVYDGETEGVTSAAAGRVWDVVLPASERPPVGDGQIVHRRHLGGGLIRWRCLGEAMGANAEPVEPTFEMGYLLLLRRSAGGGAFLQT